METASKLFMSNGLTAKKGLENAVMEKSLRLAADKGSLNEVKILMKAGALITKDQVRKMICIYYCS